jgi:hypothetical protein
MRADLAPFGVDAMLALAGLAILVAIDFVPRRASSILGALGLAYITGTAIVPLALTVALVLGIPFTLVTFVVVVAACVLAGGVSAWRRAFDPSPERRARPRLAWREWPAETWVVIAFVVVFGAYWIVGLLSAFQMPLFAWDSWTIWARKAEVLTAHNSLVSDFFTNQSYSFSHLEYPLQLPIWEAIHFRAAATFDMQAVLRHVWLLMAGFVWAIAYVLREQVRPVVWAPLLLLAAGAPGVGEQLLSGYADVPMAIFACLAVAALGLWLQKQETRHLALAAIFLAATANTKNEGLAAAVVILAVTGLFVLLARLRLKPYVIAAGAVILSILPWRIWLAAHGIEGSMPIAKGLQPGYLLSRIDRVGPAISAINNQLAEQGKWLYLVPLAAVVVLASLVSGVGRRIAAFYLASFALVWMAFVWSYWISPFDLSWHLAGSVTRVVSMPIFICLAAVLHLSGLLVGALAPAIHENELWAARDESTSEDAGARAGVLADG